MKKFLIIALASLSAFYAKAQIRINKYLVDSSVSGTFRLFHDSTHNGLGWGLVGSGSGGGSGDNNYPTSASFTNNRLTINRNGLSAITADLDSNKYHSYGFYDSKYQAPITVNGQSYLTWNNGTLTANQIANANLAGSITASKLVGTDIATVGTITSGVWNGTAIGNAYIASGLNANKIGDGTVSNTAYQYIAGLTSNAQTQLSSKVDSVKVSGDVLNYYKGSTPTEIAGVTLMDTTGASMDDEVYYDPNDGYAKLRLSRADTVRVLASNPATGNIYVNSSDATLRIKIGDSWYSATLSEIITLEYLDFTTNTGLSNASNVWSSSINGNYYLNYGLANKHLEAGDDGYIKMQYKSADGYVAIIAFNTTQQSVSFNTNPSSPGSGTNTYEAAIYALADGSVYAIDNQADGASIGATVANNDYLRIIRTSGVLKAQKSSDGTSWTDIYTYSSFNGSGNSNNNLYINCAIHYPPETPGTITKLYYPQGYNLTSN